MPRNRYEAGEAVYMRAAELPPLHPDERVDCIKRLTTLYEKINRATEQDRREKLLRWTDFAP